MSSYAPKSSPAPCARPVEQRNVKDPSLFRILWRNCGRCKECQFGRKRQESVVFRVPEDWPAARREQLLEALRTGRAPRPEDIVPVTPAADQK
jgi:hypothetical protein